MISFGKNISGIIFDSMRGVAGKTFEPLRQRAAPRIATAKLGANEAISSAKNRYKMFGDDLRSLEDVDPANPNKFAETLQPDAIHNWFNTRVFGKPVSDPTYARTQFPSKSNSAFDPSTPGSRWAANAGAAYQTKEFVGRHYKKGIAAVVGYNVAAGIDRAAGYAYGGPGYGGYIGFGEGLHSEQNALQGAVTNTNYQAQMMGLQALSSNQVAPQYSLTIAPMRQRRASGALRDSTQGLTLGLNKGRHGGY